MLFGAVDLILLHAKPPVHDAHQRHELRAVVFHEKNVAIAHLESRRIGRFHRVAVHGAAKHSDRVLGAERALDRIFDLESDVGNDVALGSFAGPFRFQLPSPFPRKSFQRRSPAGRR